MSSTDDSQPGPAPDSDQLPLEDTLVERGTDDILNEGYSPPERSRGPRWGETAYEEAVGEPLEKQLAAEEPESGAPDPARQMDRAGRLVEGEESDEAVDVGVAGGAASAEEGAMHLLDENGQPPPGTLA